VRLYGQSPAPQTKDKNKQKTIHFSKEVTHVVNTEKKCSTSVIEEIKIKTTAKPGIC
jgi:hypothetical protein